MAKYRTYIIFTIIILSIISFSIAHVSAQSSKNTVLGHQYHQISEQTSKDQINIEQNQNLTKKQIVHITNKFMDHLVQDIDQNTFEVKKYHSLEEYKASFKNLASKKVVNEFVDFYYEEKGQALYIIPTETPPWFVPENTYEITPLENDTYRVKQSNDIELYGKYTIILDIKLNEKGEPYIMNVQYQ